MVEFFIEFYILTNNFVRTFRLVSNEVVSNRVSIEWA